MSEEPKQAIETQLREYAECRRLEIPPNVELDGATRRRLQDEVRRVYDAEARSGATTSGGGFWMRLVLVGASAAVLLLVSVRMLDLEPGSVGPAEGMELAALEKSDRGGASALTDREEVRLAPSPDKLMSTERVEVNQYSMPLNIENDRASTPVRDMQLSASPPPSPLAAPAPTASLDGLELRQEADSDRLAGATTFGAVIQPLEEPLEGTTAGREFQQVQQYRRNLNSPSPPQVLQSFRWVQEGAQVRVIDEDGSVYYGQLKPGVGESPLASPSGAPTPAAATRSANARPLTVQREDLSTGSSRNETEWNGEGFVVSGTNRTLNLRVEFEGVFIPAVASAGPGLESRRVQASDAEVQIQGQVVVGGALRMGIVASPRTE